MWKTNVNAAAVPPRRLNDCRARLEPVMHYLQGIETSDASTVHCLL